MTVVDRFVQARSHGGAMRPTLIVVHSAETPLRAGYAKSIAENWFATKASTSAHFMIDPVETIRLLSDNVVSYAVGPRANGFTLNVEQAGYARLTRSEWTTADGLAQMDRVAALIRERANEWGIPLRWATDQQIRAAARGVPGGVTTHDRIAAVLGGTTHTDPMPHYPGDLLEQRWADTPNPQEDDMPLIYAATGARAPVLFDSGCPVELYGEEEKANLAAAGVKTVWVEKGTLDALIAEARARRPTT